MEQLTLGRGGRVGTLLLTWSVIIIHWLYLSATFQLLGRFIPGIIKSNSQQSNELKAPLTS